MPDPIPETEAKIEPEIRPLTKVYGAPRELDDVRRLSKTLDALSTLPHEVARLRKELEGLKPVPRDLARAEGACAAARRSAETRLRAIEVLQHNLSEALASWKSSRQELDTLEAQARRTQETLGGLAGLPREFAAAAEAWKASEVRFEARLLELEASTRAVARTQEEGARSDEAGARALDALRAELARLQGLPQRLEEEGQAGVARQRADGQRFNALEAQARDLDRRSAEMERFAKEATRHLEGILQRVADALPEDALGRLCGQMEELERRLARLEFRK